MDTSRKGRLGILTAACLLAVGVVVAQSAAPGGKTDTDPTLGEEQAGITSSLPEFEQLPDNMTHLLHTADGQTIPLNSASANPLANGERLVYKSTRGNFVIRGTSGATNNQRADDISTLLLSPCGITRIRVQVNGGVVGGGGTFNAGLAAYHVCPSAGGTSIAETRRAFFGLNDDINVSHWLEAVFPTAVVLNPNFYLWVSFSTQSAGVVGGAPPERGFSNDSFWSGANLRCDTFFGGAPAFPHGSFNVEVYADSTCPAAYLGYAATNNNAPAFLDNTGGQIFADDLTLALGAGNTCELASYEIVFKATSANITEFNITTGIRTLGSTVPLGNTVFSRTYERNPPAEEPERRFVTNGLVYHRFVAPPGVFLPNTSYLTWQVDRNGVGVLVPGRAQAGTSLNTFWQINPTTQAWTQVVIVQGPPAIMHIIITCRGEEPLGACCPTQQAGLSRPACVTSADCPQDRQCVTVSCTSDADCPAGTCSGSTCTQMACGEAVCFDQIPVISCVEFGGRWAPGSACSSNPFNPPCGTHACCTPGDACQNLTYSGCQKLVDPDSPTISCTTDEDCFPNRTCQANNLCSPRRGVWNTARFCNDFDFACGFYDCLFAANDCFVGVPEIICENNEERNCTPRACTFDFECVTPYSGDCVDVPFSTVDYCTTPLCGDRACLPTGVCQTPFPDDALCPLGTECEPVSRACSAPVGCQNVACCNSVCSFDSFCCSSAWDETCAGHATDFCDAVVGNNFCFCRRCSQTGLQCEVDGNCPFQGETCDISSECGPAEILVNPQTGIGQATADNSNASTEPDDPALCCSDLGPGASGSGTAWYKFTLPLGLGNSARIHTCNTPGSTQNSILQLFSVGNPTNAETACDSLEAIACSDDFPSCAGGVGADICAKNLVPGATYYIMLASKNPAQQTDFTLTIQVPCTRTLLANDNCDGATTIPSSTDASVPFALSQASPSASATMDCPSEPCVPAMLNDVWFDHQAACAGNLTVETCGTPAGQNNPATTLAVYQVIDVFNACPPDVLLGCNDNAAASPADALLRPQSCSATGAACQTNADCGRICTGTTNACATTADCNVCSIGPRPCTSNNDCKICSNNNAPCVTNADCTSPAICLSGISTCQISGKTCDSQVCDSSCGTGSAVTVPVFFGSRVKIRVGGEQNGTPSGNVRVRCVPDDCNSNGVPDGLDIQINGDCNDNGEPDDCDIANGWVDCQPDGIPDRCQISVNSTAPGGPFYCVSSCKADANNNGIPDECGEVIANCEVIVSSVPANCDIDARQPHTNANTTPQGWNNVQITFENSGANPCDVSQLNAGSFVMSTNPGPTAPPNISSVSGSGATATIVFSAPIPTNQWTCVTRNVPGGDALCLGFLPGDVNGSRTTNAQDITALINSLNGVTPLPLTRTDMNRSATATATDITRLIDMLNGAGVYDPWSNQRITTVCPTP